jgi:signal peptidase I
VSLRRLARGNQVVEFVLIVAIALALAFGLQAFVVKPYRIPSGSMEPTLAIGQRVLVDRIGNDFFAPSVGDIVVFHPPAGAPAQICGNTHEKPGQPCDRPTRSSRARTTSSASSPGPGTRSRSSTGTST